MKTTIKIFALALSVTPALAQATPQASARQPRTLNEALAASTLTYQALGSPGMSPVAASDISSRILALSGAELDPAPMAPSGQLVLQSAADPAAILHVDAAASTVVFRKGMRGMDGLESTPNLPAEAEASVVAVDLIDQLDLAPLVSEELVLEHVGGMGMGVQLPDGSTQTFDKLRSVRFGRRIDGKRVMGPGSRISVQLGAEGQLHGLVHRWQEFEAVPLTPAQRNTPEELRAMLNLRLMRSAADASALELESLELVLFDDGRGVMEPVIHVVFQMTIESRQKLPSGEFETHTMRNPLDFFLPVLSDSRAQLPFVTDLQALAQAAPARSSDLPTAVDQGDEEE